MDRRPSRSPKLPSRQKRLKPSSFPRGSDGNQTFLYSFRASLPDYYHYYYYYYYSVEGDVSSYRRFHAERSGPDGITEEERVDGEWVLKMPPLPWRRLWEGDSRPSCFWLPLNNHFKPLVEPLTRTDLASIGNTLLPDPRSPLI